MKISIIEKYFYFAFTYSGIRKVFYTYDTKYKQKIDHKEEEMPILYTHRIVHFLFAGIMGLGLAPTHLVNDIERLEIYVRNIKPLSPITCKLSNDIDFYTVLWDQHKAE